MTTKISRHDQLIRAAKLRAMLVGFLNTNAQDVSLTRTEISVQLGSQLSALEYTDTTLDNYLASMARGGLIGKAAKNNGRVTYCSRESRLVVNDTESSTVTKHKKHKEDFVDSKHVAVAHNTQVAATKKATTSASLVVDIVKSTNRVRLTLNGLVIEIGVVD